FFKKPYHKWADKHKFKSKLPNDVKARKNEVNSGESSQTTLIPHLKDLPVKEKIIPYTDALFREAAIEWLIATDQPIAAFDHPKFQRMIAVAACSTNGVKLPGRKSTRNEIMKMFQDQLTHLQNRLNVSLIHLCFIYFYIDDLSECCCYW
ncbi:hypothetical protein BDZ94DRAFT_1175853, partial [Collybia nuda]